MGYLNYRVSCFLHLKECHIFLGDALRRKRSKSEDMDNVHSKRRRCLEEEYEAEFEVKITTRGDVNQKLEKVEEVSCFSAAALPFNLKGQ